MSAPAPGPSRAVEAVTEFMHSPLWAACVQSFVDEHCASFDGEEESQFIHTTIHENFKQTVEELLEGYLRELNLTPEQFVAAVADAVHYDRVAPRLLDLLLGIDDFLVFKQVMWQRNLELDFEVATSLRGGHITNEDKNEDKGEEEELAEAIRLSLATFEAEEQTRKEEISLCNDDPIRLQIQQERRRILATRLEEREEGLRRMASHLSVDTEPSEVDQLPRPSPTQLASALARKARDETAANDAEIIVDNVEAVLKELEDGMDSRKAQRTEELHRLQRCFAWQCTTCVEDGEDEYQYAEKAE